MRRKSSTDSVRIPRERFTALVEAAKLTACICADPENRQHDGMCISCWALRDRIQALRSSDYFRIGLARMEDEQRLRAEQLPAAEAALQRIERLAKEAVARDEERR